MSTSNIHHDNFERADSFTRRVIQHVSRIVVCVSGLLIITLVCARVLIREIFGIQVLGLAELSVLAVLWLWFFGAVLAANSGFYIVGGLPFRSPAIRRIVRISGSAVGLVVAGVFAYFLYEYCEWVVMRDLRSVALSVPIIASVSGPLLAMLMIFVISILELIGATLNGQEDS